MVTAEEKAALLAADFADLRFPAPAAPSIVREIDGHIVFLHLYVEYDGQWWSTIDMHCDGEEVEFASDEIDVIQACCHDHDFDNEDMQIVLGSALARHLAGRAVQ